jgi:hypothetical protein
MTPHGLNIGAIAYWLPCPFMDQVMAALITPSQTGLTLGVPLEAQSHNWTLIASPDVTQVRLPTQNINIKGSGTFTFDAVGTPGHGTTIALTTATPDKTVVQLVRTDWLDEFNAGQIFTPDALDVITGSSCLRFMDWCHTNDSAPNDPPITAWTPMSERSYHGKAVPIEQMVALCNAVGADMWLNIPAALTMDEAKRVIVQARSLLLPGLKLHLEWSNEVWNTAPSFKTGRYALTFPGGPIALYGGMMAALGSMILGMEGVDLIPCWKWVSPAQMHKVVSAYKAAGGSMDVVSAFGFAPYPFNQVAVSTFLPDNYDGLLDELDRNRKAMASLIPLWVEVGKTYGKPVVRYEEALSPFVHGDVELAFCIKALQLPRAGQIMRALWADLDAAGCGFGCFYNSASTGVFGFAPDYGDVGYPQRVAWQRYNRRAWPMARVAA